MPQGGNGVRAIIGIFLDAYRPILARYHLAGQSPMVVVGQGGRFFFQQQLIGLRLGNHFQAVVLWHGFALCVLLERKVLEPPTGKVFRDGAVKSDHPAAHRQHLPTQLRAGKVVVRNLDNVVGQVFQPFAPHGKRHCILLAQPGLQYPLPVTHRLPACGAAERGYRLDIQAVTRHCLRVGHILGLAAVAVVFVGKTHQHGGISGFQRYPVVGKLPVHHIAVVVLRHRVAALIQQHRQLVTVPQRHPAKGTRQFGKQLARLPAVGQVGIAGKARLQPAEAVRHHLITITGYLIQAPFVDVFRRQTQGQR